MFSPVPTSCPPSSDLISAVPWYKTVAALHLWDPSVIDCVLVSSPPGLLGLPFFTRKPGFSNTKIYATEVTVRIGQLMMEELVSLHSEFLRFYGPSDNLGFPHWLKWAKLANLSVELKRVVLGEEWDQSGGWLPLYSAEDIKNCIQKINLLKYGEETCFNGKLVIKAFSSGLEIGSCNWSIKSTNRSIVYLSSSLFGSDHSMEFDYNSLKEHDLLLFSDFSGLNSMDDDDDRENTNCGNLSGDDEILEESEKIDYISSCIANSIKNGGSVLIPLSRLGLTLQLLENISETLDSYNLKVPIYMISETGEETLAFANAVPEWLCKKRQEKLFSGEALFGNVELLKEGKLFLYPFLHSSKLLSEWNEPCIVLCTHWSLRIGSVVQLLKRWSADSRSLLILEDGIDAELALSPFKPVEMKVLQCSFLSGLKRQKVIPLLEALNPKLILFPERLRSHFQVEDKSHLFLYYSKNKTITIPGLIKELEAQLATELAFQLKPKKLRERDLAIARLKGKIVLKKGIYQIIAPKKPINESNKKLIHWGRVDPTRLILALQEREINGLIQRDENNGDLDYSIQINKPVEALVKASKNQTVISCEDERISALIYEAISTICDGI